MEQSILTGYINSALSHAVYDKLEDGSFAGRIPACKGVIAFGKTLRECENELQSTFEDWVLLGLRMGHTLPILGSYCLNMELNHEPLASLQA